MPDELQQVFTGWASRSGEPVLCGPLAGTRPPHHGFDGLMGGTQFVAQCNRDRLSVAY